MSLKNSNLAWITVSDFKKAKDFFSNVLGLTLKEEHEQYQWMEFLTREGEYRLGVGCNFSENSPVKAGNNAVVTFTVDDITATKAELEKKGVQFIGTIMEVPGHVKLALFSDPDGNKFQLVELIDSK